MDTKKYGLQLRVQPSQQLKKQLTKPPLPSPLGFCQDDDDDVESDISRQACKNRARKEIEEQHKKALEEDPSVFDYDGVYDEMKEKSFRHKLLNREDKKPKYIHKLMQKAEERKREHDIVYEKKLARERSEEDHLYADKDKFVTSAYKKKLAEQEKWAALQRLRDLQDEKEDVTKKKDLTDFYFNIGKNVAFGGRETGKKSSDKLEEIKKPEKLEEQRTANSSNKNGEQTTSSTSSRDKGPSSTNRNAGPEASGLKEEHRAERRVSESDPKPVSDGAAAAAAAAMNNPEEEKAASPADQPRRDHHKRTQDAVAAAKERYLARKRAKEQ